MKLITTTLLLAIVSVSASAFAACDEDASSTQASAISRTWVEGHYQRDDRRCETWIPGHWVVVREPVRQDEHRDRDRHDGWHDERDERHGAPARHQADERPSMIERRQADPHPRGVTALVVPVPVPVPLPFFHRH